MDRDRIYFLCWLFSDVGDAFRSRITLLAGFNCRALEDQEGDVNVTFNCAGMEPPRISFS